MLPSMTPEGQQAVDDIARRNGVSLDAALTLLDALMRGNGYQAQFSHPELGGMGQWSQGGMIMIGDMFNQGLKYRVDQLCNELGNLMRNQPVASSSSGSFQSQSQSGGGSGVSLFFPGSASSGNWWPSELGNPASSGAQNDLRYAYFPSSNRLAITKGGDVRVYDTGNHIIGGYSQQQGGDQSLTFTSQFGVVRVADLPLISPQGAPSHAPIFTPELQAAPAPVSNFAPEPAPTFAPTPTLEPPVSPPPSAPAPQRQLSTEEILRTIESLGELRKKDILTEEEFVAKKASLLSRL